LISYIIASTTNKPSSTKASAPRMAVQRQRRLERAGDIGEHPLSTASQQLHASCKAAATTLLSSAVSTALELGERSAALRRINNPNGDLATDAGCAQVEALVHEQRGIHSRQEWAPTPAPSASTTDIDGFTACGSRDDKFDHAQWGGGNAELGRRRAATNENRGERLRTPSRSPRAAQGLAGGWPHPPSSHVVLPQLSTFPALPATLPSSFRARGLELDSKAEVDELSRNHGLYGQSRPISWDVSVAYRQHADRALRCCDRSFDSWIAVRLYTPSPRDRVPGACARHGAFFAEGLHRSPRAGRQLDRMSPVQQ